MAHHKKQADPDVARTLVAGLSGIHPASMGLFVLFAANTECGVHLTTNGCCAYHAAGQVLAECAPELSALTPCSGDGR